MADPKGPGIVDGTERDDDVRIGFTDSDGDTVDNSGFAINTQDGDDTIRAGKGDDTIFAGGGDDRIFAGSGDDLVFADSSGTPEEGADQPGDELVVGGLGNDTIFGGAGDDTIIGDFKPNVPPATGTQLQRESFNWDALGASDGDPLTGIQVQHTGSISVAFASTGVSTFENDAQLTDGLQTGDEVANPNSSAEINTDGGVNESAVQALSFSKPVENVQFRINDLDENAVVKVSAWGPDGRSIEVTMTASELTNLRVVDIDGDGFKGAAVRNDTDDSDSLDPDNSVVVDIPGPVLHLEIRTVNLSDTPTDATISDVFFDALVPADGVGVDDLLVGGQGDDYILGQFGDDTLAGGAGDDTLIGGEDQDSFVLIGPGDIIDGSETGVDFDTINLFGAAENANPGGTLRVERDAGNPENGTIRFIDADGKETGYATFYNIENFTDIPVTVCFTPGTRILTPMGEIPVEQLQVGDRVVTRDNGLQEIRWTGRKHLDGRDLMLAPKLRPIRIKRGALGPSQPERDMLVSPNHRMLLVSEQAELLFEQREVLVAAKHLTHLEGVAPLDVAEIDYIHIMCDHHEIVLADGTWSESFQPGDYSLDGIGAEQREEIYALFPELQTREGLNSYSAARMSLKRNEARLLG